MIIQTSAHVPNWSDSSTGSRNTSDWFSGSTVRIAAYEDYARYTYRYRCELADCDVLLEEKQQKSVHRHQQQHRSYPWCSAVSSITTVTTSEAVRSMLRMHGSSWILNSSAVHSSSVIECQQSHSGCLGFKERGVREWNTLRNATERIITSTQALCNNPQSQPQGTLHTSISKQLTTTYMHSSHPTQSMGDGIDDSGRTDREIAMNIVTDVFDTRTPQQPTEPMGTDRVFIPVR